MNPIYHLKLTWRLFRDSRVPGWVKLTIFMPFIYLVWPIDFIPDFIPLLGQIDDLGVFVVGFRLFYTFAPAYLVQEHRERLDAEARGEKPPTVIDAPYYEIRHPDDQDYE